MSDYGFETKAQRIARGRSVGPGAGWENAGGMVELGTNGFGNRKLREAMLRVMLEKPCMMLCELSSEVITPITVGTSPRIQAIVNWQTGRAGFSATVDIGQGTQFSVAAAQVIDIHARIPTDISTNSAFRVSGAVAPGTAISPVPATLTEAAVTLTNAVASADLTVPQFARAIRVLSDSLTLAPAIEVHCKVVTGTTLYVAYASDGDVPILPGVRLVHLIYAGPAGTQGVVPQWEIRL